MTSPRFVLWLALVCASVLAGCPSATTLDTDAGGGGGDDAAGSDAAGNGDDAASGTDTGAASGWNACSLTSECGLASAGCCEPCGTPTLDQYDAINLTQRDAHFTAVCPAPTPCPRCAVGSNPNLVATCELSHCAGHDLSMMPLSACNADSDCIIRYANCCSCSGDPSEVVSVRGDAEGAVEQLLCDGGSCPLDCAPRADPDFAAMCDVTTHHCVANRVTIGP
jgi:hypothetical protein